jgi:CHAT domain-containing protein/tetratricopeptide (TPR) repeat protein
MTSLSDDQNSFPPDAERLLKQGRTLLQQGQAPAALELLRQALSQTPGELTRVRLRAECHAEIGLALQRIYQPDEALKHLEKSLQLFERSESTEREQARCLCLIAQALWGLARYEQAITRQEQALVLLRPLPDAARDQGICHMNLGVILSLLGRHEEAIREHEQALALHRSVAGTEVDQAKCLANIGGCMGQLQRPIESLARQEEALALLQGAPHTEVLQALCHERVGLAHWDLGCYEEAIDTLERALMLLRGVQGSERAQAKQHAHVGSMLACLGRYLEAQQKHAQALALYRQSAGTERQQAWSLVEIGRSLIGLRRYEEAIEQLESALTLFQPIQGAEREQTLCAQTLGQALVELGRRDEAMAKYDEAMVLLDAIDAPALNRAMGHRLAAEALRRGGAPEAALGRYEEALALYEPEQDREELWQAWYGVGQAREALGDTAGALAAYLTATEYLEGLRDDVAARANKVTFFQDKAAVYGRLIGLLLEGGRTSPPTPPRCGEGRQPVLTPPPAPPRSGEGSRPTEHEASPSPFRGGGQGEGLTIEAGGVGQEERSPDSRLARYGDSPEAIALAFAEAAKARALSDVLGERILSPPPAPPEWVAQEQRLGQEISRLYVELQALGREPGEPGRVLRERVRALELERDILEVRIKRAAPRALLPPPLRSVAEIQALLEPDTALLEYALLPAPAVQLPAPGHPQGVPLQMAEKADPSQPEIVGAPLVGALEPRTGAERLALWVVTREGLRTFLVDLPAGEPDQGLPQMVRRLRLQPGRLSLEERVRLYRYPMERRLKTDGKLGVREHQRAGRLLADLLLPPEAREYLATAGVRQLAIVPDGVLHHVPFAALIVREDPETVAAPRYEACHYLVHDYAVACIPSAMALAALRRAAAERRSQGPDRRRSVLAFADPVFTASDPRGSSPADVSPAGEEAGDGCLATQSPHGGLDEQRLPATAGEARAVAALFPDYAVYETPEKGGECSPSAQSEVYLGVAATKERLRSINLSEFRYLILATHAHVDEENPMRSYVRLTATSRESGFLPAQEIFGLELDAEMVTLSACESGLGRLARGEGIVGLSTAFFSAGARSLLTSLWKVLDEPTASLVERLHAHLRSGDLSRAEALRRAQLEMIAASPPHAHPFFWAFTLMGDWAPHPRAAGAPACSRPAASP